MSRSASDRPKPVYLLGCGGHGRVVLAALQAAGATVNGILDPGIARGQLVMGVPVVGGDDCLDTLDRREVAICLGIGVMPGQRRRHQVFQLLLERGFQVVGAAHPSAVISPRHEFGRGAQIMAGAVVQCGVSLADNVIVNTRASVDHDCSIAGNVMVGPGAILCGEVSIGAGAYIGAGAVLLPGVSIGADSVVGAGSVVTRNVGEGMRVAGNPAVSIGTPVRHE
jgi:sugar O-acyltransferase (sialic acid O-acetyltransferase NeuD family)